jgi:hypothetical protein
MSESMELSGESKESRLDRAFRMVKELGLSVNKAAGLNGIPVSTLRRKVLKNISGDESNGQQPFMSAKHEAELANWISLSAKRGLSPSVSEVLLRARNIFQTFYPDLAAFKDYLPGRTWLKLFLKRNTQLKVMKANYCDKAFSRVTKSSILHWFR